MIGMRKMQIGSIEDENCRLFRRSLDTDQAANGAAPCQLLVRNAT